MLRISPSFWACKSCAFRNQDPASIEAAEIMGRLHDALEQGGYTGHDLEQFLVRLLFCLFADDTGIFEPRDIFLDLIEQRTSEDGVNTGQWIVQLFEVLDTPEDKRQGKLDEDLDRFPYVNGDLFQGRLAIPAFDADMRAALLEAARFNWSAVSPAIFGALFQSVMDKEERRKTGGHYTTEPNILKVIGPLFLDELKLELDRTIALQRGRERVLRDLHSKLARMRFLDPACGCGNFLIITYRELRTLEMRVLRELYPAGQLDLHVSQLSQIDVDQFYGIEISEFPARIAEVALWMMDHIMNNRLSLEFGQAFARIPLKRAPHITVGNALAREWSEILSPEQCTYVFGNPPFIGHQWRNKEQQEDMARIWGKKGQVNRLDYVTCWFRKAMNYATANQAIEIAFVATNSITQGEQCGILWPFLFASNLSIRFAHRTFEWGSDARGRAHVHVVIIGMTFSKESKRLIYEYDHVRGEPHIAVVSRINGYLIDGPQYAVPARTQPPPGRLKMHKGSQPTDGARIKKPTGGYVTTSNLILDEDERAELLAAEPNAKKWLRPFVGGDELISGQYRWCLWLKDANPQELQASKAIAERLHRVRDGRLKSPTPSVRAYARFPTLFTQDRQPIVYYLAIPEVSSETREYVPMDMLSADIIASNKLQIITGAGLVYLGILMSSMHMAWMRTVAGRLESRYSYAPAVYNSFPWPSMTPKQESEIVRRVQDILDARDTFRNASLDTLYDEIFDAPATSTGAYSPR